MKTAPSIVFFFALAASVPAQTGLIHVHEDFSKDPGWDSYRNRIVAENPPVVKQDFGWTLSDHTGAGTGEIGGTMWQSVTPAYYALPLNHPLSFNEPFSFSCRLVFMPKGGAGVAYLGFFNHQLQGWRVWNSMAVRLGGESGGQAAFGADSMTADWSASGGSEGYIHVPVDGKPHTLKFSYDPKALPGDFPDPRLAKYLTSKRQTTEQILAKARVDEPQLTKEELLKRLEEAHAAGLVQYLQRTGHESVIGRTNWSGYFWSFKENRAKEEGAMILQVDHGRPFKIFIDRGAHEQPVFMDRFGLFNLQLYHQYIDIYLSDLSVNGHKVDLSHDPGWEGVGNHAEFLEQDFQRENYGYSETNWAGDGIGELGGQVTSAEPVDPNSGYYGDDIGRLTLDDPISFSGHIAFVRDSTDAGMQLGFFNAKDAIANYPPNWKLHTNTSTLGLFIEGGASSGKRLMPQFTSGKNTDKVGEGFPFRPTAERHSFKFEYDPKANNNVGRITLTLDDKTTSVDLTPKQRAEDAVFDRFGLSNLRCGGKYVFVYFDDLTYTARRPAKYRPVFHKQEVVKVPYPPGGREY